MTAGTLGTRTLCAAPDWERPYSWLPLLSAYIRDVPADTACTLHLDAGRELPGALVAELITWACELLSQGRPFADIDLHAPGDAPAGERVDGRRALVRLLGLEPAPPPTEPVAIVAHAQWAKDVADQLQHLIDRSRFAATPKPAVTRDTLVTVRIPTWGDVTELMTRTLPSVLNGQWRNVEVIVSSDGPQPHARAAVESLPDPRVRYIDLPERPDYPRQPYSLWRVGGSHAVNHGLDEARGDFICPLDHDDAFTEDHIPRLLEAVARTGADFVYGMAVGEHRNGPWYLCGEAPLTEGKIAHGAVLFSQRLRHVHADPHCWIADEPGDWCMWRRMREVGAHIEFVPSPVLVHFRQRTSIEDDPDVTPQALVGHVAFDPEWAARDVLGTA
ncbi:MAG: hypothetical protein QOJ07_3263, partial [Thermoleophilaceae bacterium]|nr:hypothetical protein [Thermoleophilaceae bacterium]